MKSWSQRDVNRQLFLNNGCMHAALSLPCCVCLLHPREHFRQKGSVCFSSAFAQVERDNCSEEKFFMFVQRKKKNHFNLLGPRLFKAQISGTDSVVGQNPWQVPGWDLMPGCPGWWHSECHTGGTWGAAAVGVLAPKRLLLYL